MPEPSHGRWWLLAGLLWLLPGTAAWTADWRVQHDGGGIGFVATYDEIPFDGRFRDFEAAIRFDPQALQQSRFEVNVTIASVDSDSPDRDQGMLEPEWFDAEHHPLARFETTGFSTDDGGGFRADGELTIKGITRPVALSFTWDSDGRSARLAGETSVRRTDFEVGSGDWQEDDTIGFDVKIVFDLDLRRVE